MSEEEHSELEDEPKKILRDMDALTKRIAKLVRESKPRDNPPHSEREIHPWR